MWIPITIDEYVKIHLQKNPNEKENVLRVRIEAALDDYKNGVKCKCGKDLWIVGSATAPFACFSCITGKDHPGGEYEVDCALNKRDRQGRMHIDEMNPMEINGIFDDDGYMVDMNSIVKPALCMSCFKNTIVDWDENLLCDMNRADQRDEKDFRCGAYEKL